jgi:prepilin-type N-terminal cleavage/methylation domain-containing protein
MNDAGYTLVETLAALFIIALAVTGLSAALQVLARGQTGVASVAAQTSALRQAEATLDHLFEGRGPFTSSQPNAFTGSDHEFQFDCAQSANCVVQLVQMSDGAQALRIQTSGGVANLPLRSAGPVHFQYQGSLASLGAWPPPSEPRQTLRSISVLRNGADAYSALMETHLWTQEPVVCAFDVVLQDCR